MRKQLLFIIILIAACSPQKRLNRLIALHPYLLKTDTVASVDTVVKTNTIITPGDTTIVTNHDTVVNTKTLTIYITKETVKVITKPDTLYIHDTTFKHIYKFRERYNTPAEDTTETPAWLIFLTCAAFVFLIVYIIRKPKP